MAHDPGDPFRHLREQQRRIRRILDPPAMRMLRENQRKMNEILEPAALRQMRELQEQVQNVIDPPALRRIREQQERFQRLMESPALASAPWASKAWTDLVPEETVEEIKEYEEELVERVTENEAAEEERGGSRVLGALGYSSFRMMLWEMEILLKGMEAMAAALVAQGEVTDVEPPMALIAFIVMFVITAELLIKLSRDGPDE